jgi:hypothetical protein
MVKTSDLKSLTTRQRGQLREKAEREAERIEKVLDGKASLTSRERLQYSQRLYDLEVQIILLDPDGALAGEDLVGEVERLRQLLAATELERDKALEKVAALKETLRDALEDQ